MSSCLSFQFVNLLSVMEVPVPSSSLSKRDPKFFSMCRNFLSGEKIYCISLLAYRSESGLLISLSFVICSFSYSTYSLIFLLFTVRFACLSIIQSRGKINIPPLLLPLNIINQYEISPEILSFWQCSGENTLFRCSPVYRNHSPSMKIQSRSDTFLAKFISCVTITIVICSAARSLMTFRISPVSSGLTQM